MDKLLSFKKADPSKTDLHKTDLPKAETHKPENPKKVIPLGPGTHKVHIFSRQMGSKWITTVEDLDEDLDLKRIARYMAKAFASAATACEHDDAPGKYYLKIQGNKKDEVRVWLVENEVMTTKEAEERLVFHGV
jgi:translation initiation factor 1 (eIF-1/SUI1)